MVLQTIKPHPPPSPPPPEPQVMQGVCSIQLMLSEDEDGGDGSLGSETPDDVEAPEDYSEEVCAEKAEAPEEDQQASPTEDEEEAAGFLKNLERAVAEDDLLIVDRGDAPLQSKDQECQSPVDQDTGIGEGQAEAADTLSESADAVATAAASVAAAQEATPCTIPHEPWTRNHKPSSVHPTPYT